MENTSILTRDPKIPPLVCHTMEICKNIVESFDESTSSEQEHDDLESDISDEVGFEND